MSRSRQSGFTLVELLVVIAIIGILVGLLLPAVQAAREAARRMQCSNNMKQLALGLHNYHSTYDTFPAGVRGGNSSGSGPDTEGFGVSFFYGILPYIEQGPLYEKLVIVGTPPNGGGQHPGWTGCPVANGPAGSLNGVTVNRVVIATFNCPSNPMDPHPKDGGSGSFANLPSYIGISGGVDEDKTSATAPPAPGTPGDSDGFQSIRQRPGVDCCGTNAYNGMMSSGGALVQHDYIGFKHILDGTSNVIVLGEVGNWMRDASNNPVDGRGSHGWLMGTNGNGRIRNWDGSNQRTFNLTAIRYPINTRNYNLPGILDNFGPNNPLVSAHTGGCQVALADGSVRFLTSNMDLPLLKRLATRDSGQTKALP